MENRNKNGKRPAEEVTAESDPALEIKSPNKQKKGIPDCLPHARRTVEDAKIAPSCKAGSLAHKQFDCFVAYVNAKDVEPKTSRSMERNMLDYDYRIVPEPVKKIALQMMAMTGGMGYTKPCHLIEAAKDPKYEFKPFFELFVKVEEPTEYCGLPRDAKGTEVVYTVKRFLRKTDHGIILTRMMMTDDFTNELKYLFVWIPGLGWEGEAFQLPYHRQIM